jgi:hypothetical protein
MWSIRGKWFPLWRRLARRPKACWTAAVAAWVLLWSAIFFCPFPVDRVTPFTGVAVSLTIWAMLVTRPAQRPVEDDNYKLIEAMAKGLAAYMADRPNGEDDPGQIVGEVVKKVQDDCRLARNVA